MAKKNKENGKMRNGCGKKGGCSMNAVCGKKGGFPFLPGVVLNVKNLHLHLDERMESTNFYHNGCRCAGEDSVVVDLDEMAGKIAEQTGIGMDIVRKVLAAEDEYLVKLGVCEVVDVEECPEETSVEDAHDTVDSEEATQIGEKQEEPAESEENDDEQ